MRPNPPSKAAPDTAPTAKTESAEAADSHSLGPVTQLPLDKPGRPRAVYSTYHRWVRVSRLAIGAFVFMSAIAFIWLLPWIPSGINTKDYSPQVGFTIYLLLSVAVLGIISLLVQERTRRNRESLMVWSTVYDEVTGLHNRTYLFDRLALECERARRSGDVFSVIVIQIRGGATRTKGDRKSPLTNTALRKIAELIDSLTHPTDMVSLLSNSELAVLANRIDRESRHRLQERLSSAVARKIPELLSSQATIIDVKAGSATYGVDGSEPTALVQAARTSAALGAPTRPKAA